MLRARESNRNQPGVPGTAVCPSGLAAVCVGGVTRAAVRRLHRERDPLPAEAGAELR